jgi:hypothetical protein
MKQIEETEAKVKLKVMELKKKQEKMFEEKLDANENVQKVVETCNTSTDEFEGSEKAEAQEVSRDGYDSVSVEEEELTHETLVDARDSHSCKTINMDPTLLMTPMRLNTDTSATSSTEPTRSEPTRSHPRSVEQEPACFTLKGMVNYSTLDGSK